MRTQCLLIFTINIELKYFYSNNRIKPQLNHLSKAVPPILVRAKGKTHDCLFSKFMIFSLYHTALYIWKGHSSLNDSPFQTLNGSGGFDLPGEKSYVMQKSQTNQRKPGFAICLLLALFLGINRTKWAERTVSSNWLIRLLRNLQFYLSFEILHRCSPKMFQVGRFMNREVCRNFSSSQVLNAYTS